MFMQISIFAISGLFIFMTSVLMAVTFFTVAKSREQKLWAVFCVSVALWGLGAFLAGTATNPMQALWSWKIGYLGVLFIPPLFLHFVLVFLQKKARWAVIFSYALSGGFFLSMLFSNTFFSEVRFVFGSFYYIQPTIPYTFFLLDFIITTIITHILLYRAYAKSNAERQLQVEYFFIATFVGFFGGSLSFLPVYGIDVYPYMNFLVALFPVVMGYAILRYRLFDIRIVTTAMFIVLLNIFLAVRVMVATPFSTDQIFDIVLLISTIGIGIILVRSILSEVRAREQIEKLARELQETNERQEGLIHFIGHEVKGFLTKAQGTFAALSEGDLGPLSETMQPFVERALQDTRDGVTSVSDILKASNLKKGTTEYKKEPFNLKEVAQVAVEKARDVAEAKGLKLSFVADEGDFTLTGDKGEIADHVFRNLVDNSVNYTPTGSIDVTLKHADGKYVFTVKDTGVGITEEDKKRLFTEGGHGKESQKINVHSTGYGLFIAKKVTEGHGGTIRAESEGASKGSSFIVELPTS